MTRQLCASVFSGCLALAALASPASAAEFRAFWADAWSAGFHTQAEVETMLGKVGDPASLGELRKSNLNAVIVQVRRRFDTCYPSGVGEPYMTDLVPADYNALQAIIDAAHDTTGGKKRIEVHCWIVTFKTDKGYVYSLHHDTGNPDNYWITRLGSRTGTESTGGNFDPGHPRALKYVVESCMDLVSRFDIDGLHYDYIRFEGNTEGFNPTSVDRYRARYNLGVDPVSSDDQFEQWRRDQVSAVVRQVYARIQATKPWVLQSGSFVTWNPSPAACSPPTAVCLRNAFIPTRPYYDVYSDWDSWISEGIVDLAVPMTYYDWASLSTDFTKWINYEKDWNSRQPNRHMYIGPGTYHDNLENGLLELNMTRTASPNGYYAQGYSGYNYASPYYLHWSIGSDGAGHNDTTTYGTWANFAPRLLAEVNPTWSDIPDRPWKSSPSTGHIMGTISYAADGAYADHAQVTLSGTQSRGPVYVDGNGFYTFIDLPTGDYTVTAQKSGYSNAVATANVAIGAVTGNMYIRDLQLGGSGPRFSNVQAGDLTMNSATITWTTDAVATSQVEYGETTAYGSSSTLDENRVTSHSVSLSGLDADTWYHYRIVSTHDGGTTRSADYWFHTNGTPTVASVQATNVTENSATIAWNTYPGGSTQVEYGTTPAYGSSSPLQGTWVTAHSANLTGLTPGTTYHYRAVSGNDAGTSVSSDYIFTTQGVAPVISNVQAVALAPTSAVITWTTNVPTTSQVSYGLTEAYGQQSTLDSTPVVSHSVVLNGLSTGATYHYAALSTNGYGSVQSSDRTFSSTGTIPDVIVDNTDPGFAYLLGSSWTTGTTASHIGTDYFMAPEVSGVTEASATHKARWTPNLPVAGLWDVYIWYSPASGDRTNWSYWKVYNAGSTVNVRVKERTGGNGWTKLAEDVPFRAGTSGNVQLWNNTGITGSNRVIHGDAVRFVLKRGDPTPPSVPTGLSAVAVSPSEIQLNWTASTDNYALGGYRVYRNGAYLADAATNSFLDSGLTPNTVYTYSITAYDGVYETVCSAALARATLSVPPDAGSVTPDNAEACTGADVVWTAVGGFGAGTVQYYRQVWDQNPTHSFDGSEAVWSEGTLTTSITAPGAWYLHVQGYNSEDVPNGTSDYVIENACRTISEWRSVRTHGGATAVPIVLLADGGSTVEPRAGGIQRIEVVFSGAVSLHDAAGVTVTSGSTNYLPASVTTENGDTTLVLTFAEAPGYLPDGRCYTITIPPTAVLPNLVGDNDCQVRSLAGDITGSGAVNLGDALYVLIGVGQAIGTGTAQFDFDLSGVIDAADVAAVKQLVTSPSAQAICP